jgi:hypothetical protein
LELDEPVEPEEPDEPDEPVEPESDADEPESEDVPLSLDVVAPSPDAFELAAALDALELPRSFFAQPEPLKWIVGGANSLRIVPSSPHDGQNRGPGSFRPWRMSVRWSQAVQAYS